MFLTLSGYITFIFIVISADSSSPTSLNFVFHNTYTVDNVRTSPLSYIGPPLPDRIYLLHIEHINNTTVK